MRKLGLALAMMLWPALAWGQLQWDGGMNPSGSNATATALSNLVTGARTYAGASSAANSYLYMSGGVLTGTASIGASGVISPFNIYIGGDSVNTTTSGNGTLEHFSVVSAASANHTGAREAIRGALNIVGTPSVAAGSNGYVGVQALTRVSANLGGATGAYTNYKGPTFGGGSNIFSTTGATFLAGMVGHEFDVSLVTGSSAADKFGISVVHGALDAVRGAYDDAAISIADQDSSAVGWKYGISFGAYAHQFPFAADSTFITSQTRVTPSAGSNIALNGVDFSATTFQAGGSAFKSTGFSVDPAGQITTTGTSSQPLSVIGGSTTANYDLMRIAGSGAGVTPIIVFKNDATTGSNLLRIGSVGGTGESWLNSFAGIHLGTGSGTFGSNERVTIADAGVRVAGNMMVGSLTALTMSAGEIGISKITASGTAPGAAGLKLAVVCGTNAGTAKLTAAAGTSSTAATVLDNIGAGVTGC